MARVTDTGARIERLASALERAKALPKGTVLDAEPMRILASYTWPTLKGWCDAYPALEAANCFIRGGNGVKWQFNPVATIEGLLKIFRAEAAEASRRNLKLQQSLGVKLSADEHGANLDEVGKMVRLTLDIQKTKLDQGLYVPAERVSEFVDGYNRAIVEAILGVETEIDPTRRLPAAVTAGVAELLRNVATRAHDRAQAFTEEFCVRAVEAGTGRASPAGRR